MDPTQENDSTSNDQTPQAEPQTISPSYENAQPEVKTEAPANEVNPPINIPVQNNENVAPSEADSTQEQPVESGQSSSDVEPESPISNDPPVPSPAPTTAPSQPGIVTPEQAVPQSQPNVGDVQQGGTIPAAPNGKKGKLILLLIAIPALIVVTLVGVFLALSVFGGSIKLTSYDGDEFSVNYPEGYEQKDKLGLTYFEEVGDEDEETHSGVIVALEKIPQSISDEQKDILAEQFKNLGDEFVDSIPKEGQEIKNKQTEEASLDGLDGSRVSAELYEGDKKVGDLYITIGSDDDKFALVAVLAHVSDPGVAKEATAIMNSFKFKVE